MNPKIVFLMAVLFSLLLFHPPPALAGEYTVGDGDVLKINVYENEDLSTTVRVSADETIRVPLLGEVSVKDLTVSEVAFMLEDRFADGYLVSPQVDVFIKEYRSKNAIILGQINRPGQYELRGPITFLEFVSKAGGFTKDAGSKATIKRGNPEEPGKDKIVIDLNQLIKEGEASLNIMIRDGDNIYIAKADTYYITGEVTEPGAYQLEPGMTVIKAIAQAEGFTEIAQKKKIRIIREINGEKEVLEDVSMDERVLAEDVIVVPESFF